MRPRLLLTGRVRIFLLASLHPKYLLLSFSLCLYSGGLVRYHFSTFTASGKSSKGFVRFYFYSRVYYLTRICNGVPNAHGPSPSQQHGGLHHVVSHLIVIGNSQVCRQWLALQTCSTSCCRWQLFFVQRKKCFCVRRLSDIMARSFK